MRKNNALVSLNSLKTGVDRITAALQVEDDGGSEKNESRDGGNEMAETSTLTRLKQYERYSNY
jgi:hypothetical protein